MLQNISEKENMGELFSNRFKVRQDLDIFKAKSSNTLLKTHIASFFDRTFSHLPKTEISDLQTPEWSTAISTILSTPDKSQLCP